MRIQPAALLSLLLASCTASPGTVTPPQASAPPPVALAPVAPVPPRVLDTDFIFRGAIVQGGFAVGRAPVGTVAVTLDGRPTRLDGEGRFIVGFGRDASATSVVEARRANGDVLRMNLRVMPRDWKIERIPSLRQNNVPNPEYEKLRAAELARVKAARAVVSDATGWTEHFIWPATGRISGIYGSQRILGGEPRNPHAGVDVAAPTGTPVVSPASGVVVLAADKPFSLEGNLLIIDHGNRLFSSFLHLSRIDVRAGDPVRQGQRVGAIGMTGRATGPHLHWALSWGDVRVDPELLVPPLRPGVLTVAQP